MFCQKNVLKGFPRWRKQKLQKIKRFRAFTVFYYRSSVWLHHLRVAALIEESANAIAKLLKGADVMKTWTAAHFHDDCEMVTDDIPLFIKEAMAPDEKAELKKVEESVALDFAKQFPKTINGYSYHELLLGAIHKHTLEARVVSYFDKLDAYCESLHEDFAGNYSAKYPVMDYALRIVKLQEEFEDLAPLFSQKDIPLLNIHLRANHRVIAYENYLALGKPHTPLSIQKETEFPFYNAWRSVVLRRLGMLGLQWLTTQTEGVQPIAVEPEVVEEPLPLKLALVS